MRTGFTFLCIQCPHSIICRLMLDELIRREFNRWAREGRWRGMEKRHWEDTRQLIEMLNPVHHDNIVDLGCGVGWATRVLAERASRGLVVGIDLSDQMILQARTAYRNPANAFFLVADAARIPCRDEFFNGLLSVESIYYYPDIDGALQEMHRILALHGRAFFLVNYYKENEHGHNWAKYVDIPLQLLGENDYAEKLKKAGFSSVVQRRIVDSTPLTEDWTPTLWFPTRRDQLNFRAEGALLLVAEK